MNDAAICGKRRRVARWVFAVAALLPWGAASPAEPDASEPAISDRVLNRIQHACLDAYPEWLLAASRGYDAEPPPGEELSSRYVVYTDKGLFHSVFLEDIVQAFGVYLRPGSRFLDLGSGDGRVVFMASLYGADATGIEYDEQLVNVSRQALEQLDDLLDRDRVHLLHGDFFASSWSGYDVVYYFDLGSFEDDRLVKKITRELDPGAWLLVAHRISRFRHLVSAAELGAIHVYRQPTEAERRPRPLFLAGLAAGLALAGGLAAWIWKRR